MVDYKYVDVPEKVLEDLIRQHPEKIEEGMRFIGHQRQTDLGRLDVLLVDSGQALCVAELKVCEDDGMLWQGLDYYDFLSKNIEALASGYKDFDLKPEQDVRLLLIAPSFSESLLGRCKWLNIPLSLLTYRCISVEGSEEVLPVFHLLSIPTLPPRLEVRTIREHLDYITDPVARSLAERAVKEIGALDPARISCDPIKDSISIKLGGKLLSYLTAFRKRFDLSFYSPQWESNGIANEQDYEKVLLMLKACYERMK